MYSPESLSVIVNTLATVIGKYATSADELSFLGAVFVQIGDTLATMAVQRSLLDGD